MGKVLSSLRLDDTLSLTECTDGWWLWDSTRKMNLSIKAKSKDEAFFEALKYYQKRLTRIESEHDFLKSRVDAFVSQFIEEED